jgi:hypothetical protein
MTDDEAEVFRTLTNLLELRQWQQQLLREAMKRGELQFLMPRKERTTDMVNALVEGAGSTDPEAALRNLQHLLQTDWPQWARVGGVALFYDADGAVWSASTSVERPLEEEK